MALSLVLSLLLALTSADPCYYPNGTDTNAGLSSPSYTPCSPGSSYSMCCHIQDQCRADGLCLSTWYDNNVWRDFCTDSSWTAVECQNLCVNGTGVAYANNPANRADTSVTVTPCDNGSYCCGNGTAADNCCSNGNGVFLVNGQAVKTNPTAAPSSTQSSSQSSSQSRSQSRSQSSSHTAKPTKAATTSSSSSQPAAATTTAAASSATKTDTPKKSNAGAIAGGVVGGVVALALLAGLGWSLRRRRAAHIEGQDEKSGGVKYSELTAAQSGSNQTPHEYYGGDAKPAGGEYSELAGLPRAELAEDKDNGRVQLPQDREGGSGVRHEIG